MSGTRRLRSKQAGFALILALLALMLLTVLGLTLTTTTSTDLQIAANYTWGQQAYYNAEAGLDVGRAMLATLSDASVVLPPPRDPLLATWTEGTPGTPGPGPSPNPQFQRNDVWGNPTRNFEMGTCDSRGNQVGYGAVLDDGGSAGMPLQNVTDIFGQGLNGTFTVWLRREVQVDGAGNYTDDPDNANFILTSEGTAPFAGNMSLQGFAQQRRAVRVIEARVSMKPPCEDDRGQAPKTGMRRCHDPLP